MTDSIAKMGEFAVSQFRDAMQALLTHDSILAGRVIEQDAQLDALARSASVAAAALIKQRSTNATDLGDLLIDFRIVEDLERVGDLAKNTAKRATALARLDFPIDVALRLQQLSQAAAQQLRAALKAYSQRNAVDALAVRLQDEHLDRLHARIFREIVSRTQREPENVVGLVHLLFCAKNIERVGDHATHVAEAAYQRATGEPPPLPRRRLDDSSFYRGEAR